MYGYIVRHSGFDGEGDVSTMEGYTWMVDWRVDSGKVDFNHLKQ